MHFVVCSVSGLTSSSLPSQANTRTEEGTSHYVWRLVPHIFLPQGRGKKLLIKRQLGEFAPMRSRSMFD